MREKHLAQTESILDLFTEVLQVSITEADDATVGSGMRSLLQLHGGGSTLLEQCQEIKAYNSDNYLPLVWQFYSRYRTVLLRLVQSLDLQSTSQDQSLIEALTFVLSQAHRRSKWLAAELDLSFISDRWRRLVVEQHNGKSRLVRQQLEVCIFTYLAAELKSGDACVVGSENFADFRNQLLDWQTCQPQLEAYCEQVGPGECG